MKTSTVTGQRYPATEETLIGAAIVLASTEGIPNIAVAIRCPYCCESLLLAPSVIGRAVSDAAKESGGWFALIQRLPETHECLWCDECEQAFFRPAEPQP